MCDLGHACKRGGKGICLRGSSDVHSKPLTLSSLRRYPKNFAVNSNLPFKLLLLLEQEAF